MTDIVIPLNNQSHWDNNELRYALRSVEKYVTGVRDVHIVGNCPHWCKNVVHHYVPSSYQATYIGINSAASNVLGKIEYVIHDLSDDFLFMNDDHFFLQAFDANDIPFYYDGKLSELLVKVSNQPYKKQIWNTINELLPEHDMKNFDTHTPIVFNKVKFLDTVVKHDWFIDQGYCMKSLYCNQLKIEGTPMEDVKMIRSRTQPNIDLFLENKPMFSIDDMALNNYLKRKFETLYPKKSKYEI